MNTRVYQMLATQSLNYQAMQSAKTNTHMLINRPPLFDSSSDIKPNLRIHYCQVVSSIYSIFYNFKANILVLITIQIDVKYSGFNIYSKSDSENHLDSFPPHSPTHRPIPLIPSISSFLSAPSPTHSPIPLIPPISSFLSAPSLTHPPIPLIPSISSFLSAPSPTHSPIPLILPISSFLSAPSPTHSPIHLIPPISSFLSAPSPTHPPIPLIPPISSFLSAPSPTQSPIPLILPISSLLSAPYHVQCVHNYLLPLHHIIGYYFLMTPTTSLDKPSNLLTIQLQA